jgi:ABC-type transport system involved in multi-copper enzyme maturation permease subunit
MNPVFLKEVRSLLRERRGFLVPMVYAAVLSATTYMFFLGKWNQDAAGLGSAIAGAVTVMQLIAVAIFSPLIGAAAIAGERERGTWFSLLASPIPRWRIATGKAAASALYVLMLLSVSLPIAALSLLFGGTDLAVLAGIYVTHAIVGVTLAMLGLAISSLFQRTWSATLVAVALSLGLVIFTLALFAALDGFHTMVAPRQGPLYFNIGYSLSLFFGGDAEVGSRVRWLWHYAALAALAAASFGFVVRRLRRICD